MNTVFTWGYTGSTPDDLAAFQQATGALVCDVRYSPRSRVAHWNGLALGRLLRGNYLPVPALGNVNYKGDGPIELANPQAAWRQLEPILASRPLLLLCACARWQDCHRTVAAEFLAQESGAMITHLPGWYADWAGAAAEPGPRAKATAGRRALSLTEPWAALVQIGAKTIETRSWMTQHRGWLAIHAAKGLGPVGGMAGLVDLCRTEPFRHVLLEHVGAQATLAKALPFGAVVAVAKLSHVGGTHLLPDGTARVDGHDAPISGDELAFGDYAPGRYGWVLTDVRPLPVPVPCPGARGLWVLSAEVEAAIRAQLARPEAHRDAGVQRDVLAVVG